MSRPETSAEPFEIVGEESVRNGHHPAPRRTLTDLGNAERFADEHGDRVRWCGPWARWVFFNGKRWVPDDTGEVERMMKSTARGIYREAAEAEDSQERKAIAAHAGRSESAKRIADALRLARSEPGIPVLPGQLDGDRWLLNCENGTVDLRTGELREHRAEDLITKVAGTQYDPDAQATIFETFLARILPSEALHGFVQRAIGYAASGVVSEEVLVILYGSGANGKSTFVNAIMEALGDYATQAAPDLLMAKKGSHPTELADLFGARFVAAVETDAGRRLAEGLAKQLTGRDRIKARRMREDFWEFDPTHTVFLATNHKPQVRGTDHAIWRRLKLVPFEVAIPEAEQDKRLPEKLRAELPGILSWIIGGSLSYEREGLGEPEEVRSATERYRAEMDALGAFIEERCSTGTNLRAQATALFQEHKAWCEEAGEKWQSQRAFGMRLAERGFTRRKSGGVIWWLGIGLQDHRVTDGMPARDDRDDDGPRSDIGAKNPLREEVIRKVGPRRSPSSLEVTEAVTQRDTSPASGRAFGSQMEGGIA